MSKPKTKRKASKKAPKKTTKKGKLSKADKRYIALEKKHLGDIDKKTGIYAADFSVSAPISAGKIKLATRSNPGSKYQKILDQMNGMKVDQAITVNVPKGADPKKFHNRFNAFLCLKKSEVKPPAGCTFERRRTEDGNIAILCVKQSAAKKAA